MFKLPDLPYPYEALEPHVDAETMTIHHTKHHAGYVEKLNKALEQEPDWKKRDLEDLLRNIEDVPKTIRTAVRNNGGGHANHSLFWQVMAPNAGGTPSGDFSKALERDFGSFDSFKERFTDAALTRFGSGWAWLVMSDGRLDVVSTPNQDSPLMLDKQPLLGIDVWEHAYYLKYQNRRPEYVEAWWNLVSWKEVASRYDAAVAELETASVTS